MLNKIIAFSVRNKLLIGLFTLALIGLGIYETTRLPIDAQPDITNNQVQVITVAPSFGATDIERLVTFPIEQATSNIAGLEEIRSFSRFGLSLVTIVFTDETDIYWARQQVAERLQQVQSQIPESIGTPEMGPISTGLGEIYQYVVKPKKGYEDRYNETDLRTIQDWIVRRQLLGVKGVAEVSSFGGKLKQYEIAVNPNKLQAFDLSINDVFEALEENNQNTGGAYIEKASTVLYIRSEGLIGSVEDIENIAVKSTESGIPVLLKNIAEVKIGHAIRYGAIGYNDEGEVAGAIVMMLKGANSNEVIQNVKDRIAIIQKTLPEGVEIEPFLDRTKMVNNAIDTVLINLSEGALIVVFILVLFLGNFRAGLLVASVIPLSMLFAIIMMNAFGVSGNLMSLGALDFGLIVDGAVIIVEAVMHQLYHRQKLPGQSNLISQKEMDGQVRSSAGKMVNSAVFGQIIILIVYLPIFALQGIEGKMFKPMAQTVAFALIGAFILSLTYIPMMSALVLSKNREHKPNFSDKMMYRLQNLHQGALVKVLRFPKVVVATMLGLFALAILVFSRLGGEFIPALEEGDFAVETRILTGSTIEETLKATQKAAHILKTEYPEVESVVTKIGSAEVPTEPMPMDAGDMIITLKDKKQWTSAESFDELAQKMSKSLEAIPGMNTSFQFPVQMRFNELISGARQDIVVKIFGEDLDTLAYYAQRFGQLINTVEGTQDLYVEPVVGMPQVVIEYNRPALAQYNLSISEINRIVNTAFAGQTAGLVFEGEKRFDLVVRSADEQRKSMEDIRNLLIPTPQGLQIPLRQLADVEVKNGPFQIQREDAKRRIIVGFNARGRDVQSLVNELQTKADQQLNLPPGYTITYGGTFENLNKAKDRLMIAVPFSLLLIFILLYFAFNSVKNSLLIYSAIPLSAIGGIFLLALRGLPFSISAGVGFIALFGVAVLNGIVLVAEFNRLKTSGMRDLSRIVLAGTRVRLRPVLMTAFVASLGFLPMALSKGAGAEVQRPLATVVIGGLLLATFLTLFVLPVLYILFEKATLPKSRFKKALLIAGILSLSGTDVFAQQMTLSEVLKKATEQNFELKNTKLLAEYQKLRIRTAYDLPQTNATAELGQFNSNYFDSRIGISQTLNFPTVYARQKKVLEQEWHTAVLNSKLAEAELKKNVTGLFYHILVLLEQEKILLRTDSLYQAFLQRAELRFAKGATDQLEKTSARIQRENSANQLRELQTEIQIAKLQLQLLLNASEPVEPIPTSPKLSFSAGIDSVLLQEHATLQVVQQQLKTADAELKLERSKLLPSLSLGYFNQSFVRTEVENQMMTSRNRFSSVEVGVGIPLFSGAQRAQIKASEKQVDIAQNELKRQKAELQTAFQTTLARYKQYAVLVASYEQTQLLDATIMQKTAQQQFTAGEINYLEWVLLNNQALQLQANYFNYLSELNQSVITLQYLLSK
ncbi:CusA/CzcA family heavy metal efflux RND transporter [Adhaeribacter sp. BT258]|uniref:CusA/CzcA family heavy metal efflux RND transporter n=1 Tax=Adhaeribacter terrigena TaxID=2793070 RepID=A0ABS1C2V9_9BACT|nr:CusA/CzcA family heavy metal efflux RND transporter [Adhaeribacter terrigena]MBK0402978.1 CusA/CzcA family heavy metal efflux RND transporter [Adhaeribacter terrigena]